MARDFKKILEFTIFVQRKKIMNNTLKTLLIVSVLILCIGAYQKCKAQDQIIVRDTYYHQAEKYIVRLDTITLQGDSISMGGYRLLKFDPRETIIKKHVIRWFNSADSGKRFEATLYIRRNILSIVEIRKNDFYKEIISCNVVTHDF